MFHRLFPPVDGARANAPNACLSALDHASFVVPVDPPSAAPIVIGMEDPTDTTRSRFAPQRPSPTASSKLSFSERSRPEPLTSWQMATAAVRSLGPITEPRFAEAFHDRALVSAKVASKLIGVDTLTLSAMADAGIVQAVRKGRQRNYAEHALRTYLLDGPDLPEARPRERAVSVPRKRRAAPFSKRSARQR